MVSFFSTKIGVYFSLFLLLSILFPFLPSVLNSVSCFAAKRVPLLKNCKIAAVQGEIRERDVCCHKVLGSVQEVYNPEPETASGSTRKAPPPKFGLSLGTLHRWCS